MLPFELFKAYGTTLMGETYSQSKQLKTWVDIGRRVTPRAELKFQIQSKAATEYSAVFSSDDVAFVYTRYTSSEVATSRFVTSECSCVT